MWRCLVPKKYPSRHIGFMASPSQRLPSIQKSHQVTKKNHRNGYGSIPINTIFSGMNIHLPAILMFTRGTRFWPIPLSSNVPLAPVAGACHPHTLQEMPRPRPFPLPPAAPETVPVVRHCNRLRRHGFRGVRWGRGGPGLSRNKISGQWEVWKNTAVMVQF